MLLLIASLLVLGAAPSFAQTLEESSGAYRMKVDTHLVDTTFTVRNARGELVTDLPQNVFHVREDGAEQTIRYFVTKRELPLSIGILVDESDSQDRFVKEHEKQIEAFLREVMEPHDRAFAICFGNHLRLTSDWTNNAHDILSGIHDFDKGERSFPELADLGKDDARVLGTALYDGVFTGVQEKLAAEAGRRKVLLIFSDGEENSSEHDLIDAIEAAQNADVLVYALRTTDVKHRQINARNRYGMRVLDHMTDATGGQAFDVRATKVDEDFQSIAADLRSLYEVGYYSTNKERDRRFRKVTIQVDGEGLKVRARSGYTPKGGR